MSVHSQRIVIITAPSGAGKTTITRHLLDRYPDKLAFSVSAATREPRGKEVDGQDYHFMTAQRFRELIEEGAFLEWEMVYEGKYYGTLMSEVERIWTSGRAPMLDIDVKGAMRVMEQHRPICLSIFIKPPSLQELERRLRQRGTDPEDSIRMRLEKADFEMSYADRFDHVIVNDDLQTALASVESIIGDFLTGDT
ncbi:MAG: guanylate kinase [Bacteroidota bacterium]|jgi:guanylate kinase